MSNETNQKKSSAGGLHKYANLSLIDQEKDAWKKAAIKKHLQEQSIPANKKGFA